MQGSYNRHRQTDERLPAAYGVFDFAANGASQGQVRDLYQDRCLGHNKAIDDIYDSSYYRRVRNGEVIVRPMTASTTLTRCTAMNASTGQIPIWGRRDFKGEAMQFLAHDFLSDINVTVARDLSGLQGMAMTEALAKVMPPDLLSGAAIAEYHKTLDMFKSPYKSALKQLGRTILAKKKGLKNGLTVTRASANAWLETQMGWQPVIYDLIGALKAAERVGRVRPVRRVAKGGNTRTYSFTRKTVTSGYTFGFDTVTSSSTLNYEVKVGAGVIYDVWTNPALGVVSDFGLTISDVATTAWELTPYSWVADYLANTGKWLSAILPRAGVTYKGTWITTKTTSRQRSNGIGESSISSGGHHYPVALTMGEWSQDREAVARTYGSTRPTWVFSPHLNAYQATNVAALGFAKLGQSLHELLGRRR